MAVQSSWNLEHGRAFGPVPHKHNGRRSAVPAPAHGAPGKEEEARNGATAESACLFGDAGAYRLIGWSAFRQLHPRPALASADKPPQSAALDLECVGT